MGAGHHELRAELDAATERLMRTVAGFDEVELHHTDLDAGYRPDDWSSVFAALVLPEPMRTQREDRRRWFRISPR